VAAGWASAWCCHPWAGSDVGAVGEDRGALAFTDPGCAVSNWRSATVSFGRRADLIAELVRLINRLRDALVGIWGVESQPLMALYPERVATAGTGVWLWTHEASHRIQLVSAGGHEPAQELAYRLEGEKLVITLPPTQKADSLKDLAMMALVQGQQVQQLEQGAATLVLERLPYPPEMIGPYSKTAPEALSDQYVRASGYIFHIRPGFSALLSGAPPEAKRLQGVDAASFQVISDHVARDRYHAYCPELLPQADGASFSRVPSPESRAFGATPSMCDHCIGRPSFNPAIEYTNPCMSPAPSNAPSRMPPRLIETMSRIEGTTSSASERPQTVFSKAATRLQSSSVVNGRMCMRCQS